MHSSNYGYLNSAIHHPEIMEETNLIKKLVRNFNKGRAKIWEYKDLILSYKRKPHLISYKQTPFRKPVDASKTVKNLTRKLSPYNKEGFKIISIRAFLSVHKWEILTKWEKDQSTPIILNEASNKVINNLKFEYPGLQKWTNLEIINRISANWMDRDQIQMDIN